VTWYAGTTVITNYEPETLIPDPKISMFSFVSLKSLILIHVAFTLDPNPEVSDPNHMACDPDPKHVIPDLAYHVMILTISYHLILGLHQ